MGSAQPQPQATQASGCAPRFSPRGRPGSPVPQPLGQQKWCPRGPVETRREGTRTRGGGVGTLVLAPPTYAAYKVAPACRLPPVLEGSASSVFMSSSKSSVVLGYWDIRGVSAKLTAEPLGRETEAEAAALYPKE